MKRDYREVLQEVVLVESAKQLLEQAEISIPEYLDVMKIAGVDSANLPDEMWQNGLLAVKHTIRSMRCSAPQTAGPDEEAGLLRKNC